MDNAHAFWPTAENRGFNIGETKASDIRNPRIKVEHRCITMCLTPRKETTQRVTDSDLFFLYTIIDHEVLCNIPYWIATMFTGMPNMTTIFGGMLVTNISRTIGHISEAHVRLMSAVEAPHVYNKRSLLNMRMIMEYSPNRFA